VQLVAVANFRQISFESDLMAAATRASIPVQPLATPPVHWHFVSMSISRSESQYSRRRSNTTLSAFKNTLPPPPPLELGTSKVLTAWVHSTGDSGSVLLNHSCLPGVATGDLLRVTQLHDKSGFLFLVPDEDTSIRTQLQVSII